MSGEMIWINRRGRRAGSTAMAASWINPELHRRPRVIGERRLEPLERAARAGEELEVGDTGASGARERLLVGGDRLGGEHADAPPQLRAIRGGVLVIELRGERRIEELHPQLVVQLADTEAGGDRPAIVS